MFQNFQIFYKCLTISEFRKNQILKRLICFSNINLQKKEIFQIGRTLVGKYRRHYQSAFRQKCQRFHVVRFQGKFYLRPSDHIMVDWTHCGRFSRSPTHVSWFSSLWTTWTVRGQWWPIKRYINSSIQRISCL